jgi:peptide/nickel transport system substrate-binding protein
LSELLIRQEAGETIDAAELAREVEIAILAQTDPLGATRCLRFNHLQPPFDNIRMRQAVLAVAEQADFMTAVAGDPQNWTLSLVLHVRQPDGERCRFDSADEQARFRQAKKLIGEAGYKGEKIVLLDPVDIPIAHAEALVANDLLKKLGLAVELATSDWGHCSDAARVKKADRRRWVEPLPDRVGADTLDPTVNVMLRANGSSAWFGCRTTTGSRHCAWTG